MAKKISSFEKSIGKSHLDKDFLEELKHKLWSTSGTRFQASERLNIQDKYSILSFSCLSAYLVIFGLLSVYNLYNPNESAAGLIPFSITSLSIFLLVLSLFENKKNYATRAKEFHKCAMEIAELYNELQIFKSYDKNSSIEKIKEFSLGLQERYQLVLEKYENHIKIDNQIFKCEHTDYYKEIKWNDKIYFRLKYLIGTYFWYFLIMILPGVLLTWIILN